MVYSPLKKNAEIDSEIALLQAASALDAAATTAEAVNDVEGLLNVAAMWMKYGEALTNFTEYIESKEQQGEDVFKSSPKVDIGFQRAAPVEPEITIQEDEEEDD